MGSFEYIVIGAIVAAAVLYLGAVIFQKTKSISSKKDCGHNCGCDS